MAQLNVYQSYKCSFSDNELRIVGLALAHLVGMNVKANEEDLKIARELNINLLQQRQASLTDQVKATEGALARAKEL